MFHLWASWLLLILFEGKHPTLGYYAYPAAMTSIALAILASRAIGRLDGAPARLPTLLRAAVPWLVFGTLLLAFLPGAGLRTALANLQHRNDPAYDSHALARAIMRDIPPQALTAVDGAFVLDFYLADRPVLEATIHRLSYDFRTRPFEYVVFARDGLRRFLPLMSELALVRAYGDRSDPFAPYAEVYRRTRLAPPANGRPEQSLMKARPKLAETLHFSYLYRVNREFTKLRFSVSGGPVYCRALNDLQHQVPDLFRRTIT